MADPVTATPPDSSNVDNALIAKLIADQALTTLMPDGVFYDEGNPGAKKFVVVSMVTHSDVPMLGGTAYEDALYLVKAVALSSTGGDVRAAAHRINQLLHDKELVIDGYVHMAMFRESRVRATEVDEVDPTIRWQHRGGRYRVQASPL